jgi:hypothetical protein
MTIRLLKLVRAGLPRGTTIRVLADRGIGTSPLLMRGVMGMGWTLLFRVTRQSKVILPDGSDVTFYDQVTRPGEIYQASGLVFKQRGCIPLGLGIKPKRLKDGSFTRRWSVFQEGRCAFLSALPAPYP